MKRKLFLITMFIYFAISVPVKAEDEVYTEQDKKCKVWDAESQFFTYSYKTLHQEDDLPAVRKIGARKFEVNINCRNFAGQKVSGTNGRIQFWSSINRINGGTSGVRTSVHPDVNGHVTYTVTIPESAKTYYIYYAVHAYYNGYNSRSPRMTNFLYWNAATDSLNVYSDGNIIQYNLLHADYSYRDYDWESIDAITLRLYTTSFTDYINPENNREAKYKNQIILKDIVDPYTEPIYAVQFDSEQDLIDVFNESEKTEPIVTPGDLTNVYISKLRIRRIVVFDKDGNIGVYPKY